MRRKIKLSIVIFFLFLSTVGQCYVGINRLIELSNNWLKSSWTGEEFDYKDMSEEELDFLVDFLNTDPNNPFDHNNIGEYFESLGEIRTDIDPRFMDLNYDGIVNYKDFYILDLFWGLPETKITILSLETNDVLSLNNLYGEISIFMDYNTVYWVDEVLVYLNDELVDRWCWATQDIPRINLSTEYFLNGYHDLILVRRVRDIHFPTTYKVKFNNIFSNIKVDSILPLSDPNDPNSLIESYSFSGHVSLPSSVKIVDLIDGSTLWSKDISVGSFSFTIEDNIFSDSFFGEFILYSDPNYNDPNSTPVYYNADENFVLSNEIDISDPNNISGRDFRRLLKSGFSKEKANNSIMAIILPHTDVVRARRAPIMKAIETAYKRDVPFVILYKYDVNWENISYVYKRNHIRYIYWVGHANRQVHCSETGGAVQRTNFGIWEREWNWRRPFSRWVENRIFSFTRQSLHNAYPLPDDWDERGKDLDILGMYDQRNKKLVIKDACLSAFHLDVPFSYGIFSDSGQGFLNQTYVGWRIATELSGMKYIDQWRLDDSNEGWIIFWEQLGRGRSVGDALYRIFLRGSGPAQIAFFGYNMTPDLSNPDSDDNIRVFGRPYDTKFGWD